MFMFRSTRVNPEGDVERMDGTRVDSDLTRRANELYWGSDESVNQIAERLDLSKSALYGRLGPLPAGMACPLCGEEAEYANRTARDNEELECPSCGWEGAEDDAAPLDAQGSGGRAPVLPLPSGDSRRVMLGGALLGAAVGLVLLGFARRRR